jgi:hypothetical protein
VANTTDTDTKKSGNNKQDNSVNAVEARRAEFQQTHRGQIMDIADNAKALNVLDEIAGALELASSEEELEAVHKTLLAIATKLGDESRKRDAKPPNEANEDPDIKPQGFAPASDIFSEMYKLFGIKGPEPTTTPDGKGVVTESPFKGLGRLLHGISDTGKRTDIFTKMCQDKDLLEKPKLLDRYRFLEQHAPTIALDYEMAKSFVGNDVQLLDISSAIGLVRAEDTLTSAQTRKVVKGCIAVAGASVMGYLMAQSFIKMLKS